MIEMAMGDGNDYDDHDGDGNGDGPGFGDHKLLLPSQISRWAGLPQNQ